MHHNVFIIYRLSFFLRRIRFALFERDEAGGVGGADAGAAVSHGSADRTINVRQDKTRQDKKGNHTSKTCKKQTITHKQKRILQKEKRRQINIRSKNKTKTGRHA